MSATISTHGSESTVASWMISDRASFIWGEEDSVSDAVFSLRIPSRSRANSELTRPTSSTVRRGRCSIPSRSFSFTGGDKLEKHSRMLSITDTVRRDAMLGGVHNSSVDPNLL
ncbi:hypothetical protein EYF80_017810 [Liparis tanakae]|uniref:Uncharacterized protein n=1 Tax=Liparis tanakae TaxID=230148 RepID=A0A4Z2I436_9TELE|nr:hypothetical protein EYF80_017810 [Liparis tanakae]